MNHRMFLSIIVPVYNVKDYIEGCIHSLISQTEKNYEVILIDDGSTDGSFQKCKELVNKNCLFNLFSQSNKGVSSARNLGIEKALGEYISFVDADDLVSTDYVEQLLNFVTREDIDFVQFGYKTYPDNKLYRKSNVQYRVYSFSEYYKSNLYRHTVWSYMFKRHLILDNNILFPAGVSYSEDQEFLLKVICRVERIGYIGRIIYQYNVRINSAVHSRTDYKRVKCQLLVAANLIHYMKIVGLWPNPIFKREFNLLLSDFFFYVGRVEPIDYNLVKKDYYEFYRLFKLEFNDTKSLFYYKIPLLLNNFQFFTKLIQYKTKLTHKKNKLIIEFLRNKPI